MMWQVLFGLSALIMAAAVYYLVLGLWGRVARFLTAAEDQAPEGRGKLGGVSSFLVKKTAPMMRRFVKAESAAKLNQRLTMAGEPEGIGPVDFMAMQVLSALGFFLFSLIFCAFFAFAPVSWVLTCTLFLLFGFLFPHVWLRDLITKRQHKISRALPYALDLLTLSVEAGLDFAAAVNKVVEKGRGGPLIDELRLMLNQLRLGKTREEGLRTLADRTNMPQLHHFTSALIQADRMGTSLGKVLRIQSTQMRVDRTQRAEKLAGEAPVKMLFPLIFCIFPCVFVVLFAPIIYQFIIGGGS